MKNSLHNIGYSTLLVLSQFACSHTDTTQQSVAVKAPQPTTGENAVQMVRRTFARFDNSTAQESVNGDSLYTICLQAQDESVCITFDDANGDCLPDTDEVLHVQAQLLDTSMTKPSPYIFATGGSAADSLADKYRVSNLDSCGGERVSFPVKSFYQGIQFLSNAQK